MAESESGGRRWLTYGCLGCLGLVGLVVLFAGGVTGIAALRAQSEQIEERALSRELPEPDPQAGLSDPAARVPDRQASLPTAADAQAASSAAGRVILDLAHSEFRIEPGPSGEPLRVDATYDTKTYELTESFEEAGDSGPWTYEIGFRRTGSGLISGLKELFSGSKPRVNLFIPVDVPLELELRVREGAAQMELGGLWLTSADIRIDKGGIDADFDEPLRAPMDRLSIHGSMGGAALAHLGNASPRRLELEFSMGGMDADLRGEWRQDSDISIRTSMGGGAIRLPRDVVIRGLDPGRFDAPQEREPEVKLPILSFTTSSSMGEIEFYD